jgi:hypothetical protein
VAGAVAVVVFISRDVMVDKWNKMGTDEGVTGM